jgi:hypothetical protein
MRSVLQQDPQSSRFSSLGGADLIRRRGQYQIYFSAVAAAHWGIHMLTSSDLSTWLYAGPVLEAQSTNDIDAVGARDPDVVDSGGRLSLLYTAYRKTESSNAGTETQLVRASRTGTAICAGVECAAGADCNRDGDCTTASEP